ncbi:6-phosphofructokinase [Magnetococcus marinus MC-1]|uniref:ATP-dependent 6-phosphofructokinase n=1 Tax=Magnetococcus marinus (strain ATCC BAA-1437 / JCM 17883 / MC-1) TaxID=156889 RepID=A0LC22_MAGMM|nr:6-phosphofructokinase [Magnetococcus marinus]ABK45515.1 6-phosphofructokinase [Magnetococcus marinus MC-1]
MSQPKPMNTIAVMTSGGDAPGMNSAIRAVVRTAIGAEMEVLGIRRGYSGLLEGDLIPMDAASVGNILQKGGTVLGTSRCAEFLKPEIRQEAANILRRKHVDGLVVIGGNGSFNGAYQLHQEHDIPVVGVPGTIDNDIQGTHYTIGFDTAVETGVYAVDKIRDTANAHDRIFLVEVMGRHSPAIAIHTGVCTGAEHVIHTPENTDYDTLVSGIRRGRKRGKNSFIIIVAEGQVPGSAYQVQKHLADNYQIASHVAILGHLQRGGSPTAHDRFIAASMGFHAVQALKTGEVATVTACRDGRIQLVPLQECLEKNDAIDAFSLNLTQQLAI